MGDYDKIGIAIEGALKVMFVALCVFIPLGLWKLVEIVIWLIKNVDVVVR